MGKLTYNDKTNRIPISDRNQQATAEDFNEIKASTNTIYDGEDGSIVAGSIPVRNANGFIASPIRHDTAAGELVTTIPLRVPTGTVFIGNQLGIDDAGGNLIYRARRNDTTRICLTVGFDDTGTIEKPFTTDFNAKEVRFVVQSDNSAEISNTTFTITMTATADEFISKFYGQIGTVAPTSDVNIKLYFDSVSADNLVVDMTEPSGSFAIDTEFNIALNPIFGLLSGQNVVVVITSANAFTLKSNAAQTIPFYAVDRQVGTFSNLVFFQGWVDGTTYAINDIIFQDDQLYICNTAGVQTTSFASNAALWDRFEAIKQERIEITSNTTITSANVETYRRKILYTPDTQSTEIDITINEGVDLDNFTVAVLGSGALLISASGADRINGESDIRLTQFQGAKISKIDSNSYILIYSSVNPGMTAGITIQDEGSPLTTNADTLNFTGAGVTASGTGTTKTINIPSAVVMSQVVNHTATGVQNYGGEFADRVHQLAATVTNFDALIGATFADNGIFTVVNLNTAEVEFDISAVAQTFAGSGVTDVQAYDLPGNATTMFYISGTNVYPIANTGMAGAIGDHPVVLTRDTPSLTELAALAASSLNGNSALWVLANDQIAATESGVDPSIMIRALEAGLFDANGAELPTTATAKNTIVLQGGTIVRVFSSTDLRVVSAPASVRQEMMYPDIPFTGAVVMGESDPGIYNSYLRRTGTNAGGANQYLRMPSLHTVDRPSWVVAGDVFVLRHTGTTTGSLRPHFRVDNTGDTIAGHGFQYHADPGQTIAIQAPAFGVRTWQLFPVSQRSDGRSYYDPQIPMSDWYTDGEDTTATDGPIRIHVEHVLADGLVRDHIRAAGYTNNPISLAFQRKNYQDSIAWIQWWSAMGFAVPPLGTQAEEIIANIPAALTWIQANINNGADFEFNAPEGTDGIESIGFISGNTIRYTMDSVIPSLVTLNHEVVFAGCTNAVNNGTFAVTFIDAPNRIIHIENPARTDGTDDEPASPGFMDVPIYCDAVLVAHDIRTTNFNCYEDAARTSLVTVNPNWFNPDYAGVESVLAIGYNTDVNTLPAQVGMEDDDGEWFSSLGGPRNDVFYFDNRTAYQNTRYLPLNYSFIQIDTLGICNFYFDIHPDDLPVGQRRTFGVRSDPINGNNDVTIFFGRAGSTITFDEGIDGLDLLNGEIQHFEVYNDGNTSGVRVASPFQKHSPSFTLNESGITASAGVLPMNQFELIAAENEDPNFRFGAIDSNKWEMLSTFVQIFQYSCEIVFNGDEPTTGIAHVTARIDPQRDRSSTISNYENVTGSRSGTLTFSRNGDNTDDGNRPYISLNAEVRITSRVINVNDKVQFNLSFGDFPTGYSASDLLIRNTHYARTVQGRLI